jgi:hypothetical protein
MGAFRIFFKKVLEEPRNIFNILVPKVTISGQRKFRNFILVSQNLKNIRTEKDAGNVF